jgi:DNA-binding GntR family transcriptional regulator
MDKMEIKAIEPLYQQAYTELKKLILTGQMMPGDKIVTAKLAEQYGISRTPLREALRHLQSESLITQEGANYRVVELNAQDFKHLCACRLVLEKETIPYIIDDIDAEGLRLIENILSKTKSSIGNENSLDILELNARFHESLIGYCSNKWLVQLLNQVRSLLLIYRANIIKNPKHNKEIYEEHLAIFESIRAKQVDKALRLIEQHVLNDQERGLKQLTQG